MYVQPPQEEQSSVQIPRDYSGSTFSASPPPPPEPFSGVGEEVAKEVSEPPQESVQQSTEESVQASAFLHRDTPRREERCEEPHGERGGLFGRFSFLSSLLPPSRGKGDKEKRGGHSDLVEWVIIGLAVLLFLEDSTDDILPLLLLLLLWD